MIMTEEGFEFNLQPFPIQLGEIEPIRIDFEAFVPPSVAKPPVYCNPSNVNFGVKVKYRVENGTGIVIVMTEADFSKENVLTDDVDEINENTMKPPYRLVLAAAASFAFDSAEMSEDEVKTWCEQGAFFVLSPYLRQMVFDITAKSGFPTITLPLVKVPVLRASPGGAEKE